MQMEPWRKRGFVPDSDDEEEFDSIDVQEVVSDVQPEAEDEVDLEYLPIPTSIQHPESKDNGDQLEKERASPTPVDTEDAKEQSMELLSSPRAILRKSPISERGTTPSISKTSGANTPEGTTPKPRRDLKTYSRRSSAVKRQSNLEIQIPSPNLNKDDDIWNITSSPPEPVGSAKKRQLRRQFSKNSTPSKLPQSLNTSRNMQKQGEDSRTRSSSPDELNVVEHANSELMHNEHDEASIEVNVAVDKSYKEVSPLSNDRVNIESRSDPKPVNFTDEPLPGSHRNNPEPQATNIANDSDNDSPLSSPPESLHSPPSDSGPRLDFDQPMNDFEQAEQIELDIPDELMQEVTRPMRRSFRERNAIQLHPYALEMAHYQKQMRERGVKPIRMTEEEKRKRAAEAGDSQEQDSFNPAGPRSSPPPEEFLRSARRERHPDSTSEHRDQQRSPIKRAHSSKRRKRSHIASPRKASAGGNRPTQKLVVHHQTPPGLPVGGSVFDVPSSPPHSGSSPSTERPPLDPNVFRFPPGFTPPPTTNTNPNSKTTTPTIDVSHEDDLAGSVAGSVGVEQRNDEENEEGSTDSEASHVSDEETLEEREIRLMQRRTRGVLPASWVRVNAQQKSREQQKENQRNRMAATQRADGKGVAKKIIRKPGQLGETGPGQRSALLQFSDSDDSDEGNNPNQLRANQDMDEGNSSRDPEPFGMRNPFSDEDSEDMEDNRIDNMFPPAQSARNVGGKQQAMKRQKSKDSVVQKERNTKRARFQRQTRITDTTGVRRTKPPSKSTSKPSSKKSLSRQPKRPSANSAPRLGVLDAPDVTSRPRREQPQFLRVAARRARSRQDSSRQSPTRKFLQLGSRADTADANESLREWRNGSIRPAQIARAKPQPRKRQPIANLANGIRAAVSAQRGRGPRIPRAPQQEVIDVDMDQSMDHGIEQENAQVTRDATPAAPASATVAGARPKQAERRGNEWIIHRNRGITSLKRTEPRPAPMHVAGLNGASTPSLMFSQTLNRLNQDYQKKQSSQGFKPSLTLNRYLTNQRQTALPFQTVPIQPAPASSSNKNQPPIGQSQTSHRREKRKPVPRRIEQSPQDVGQAFNHELAFVASQSSNSFAVTRLQTTRPSFITSGLFNWQPSYSVDFGVSPLRSGIFFHESTFIGSGDFTRSLSVMKRDMDRDAGIFSLQFKDHSFHWGTWNESVSSQLGMVFQEMCLDIEQNVASPPERMSASTLSSSALAFRSVNSYIATTLSFIDPVDRRDFVDRAMKLAWRLQNSMQPFLAGEYNKSGLVMLSCYNMVFANQIRQISLYELASHEVADDSFDLVRVSARDTLALIMCENGVLELHKLSIESKQLEGLDSSGIREHFPSATAFIMVEQLLHSSEIFKGIFTDAELDTCVDGLVENQKDVVSLESAWRGLFTVLPLNEFDQYGVVCRDSRFKNAHDNWPLVKRLLLPALESSDSNSGTHFSYNSYFRNLLHRCHRLINSWGWRECKPILDALYDFFAARLLHNMKSEDVRGSPSFLDHLNEKPSLEVRPGDPCFHILLKIIASGFQLLALKYDKKKIRNFAWRLLPNHGRVYPKEQPLNTQDLDALRNHHDLLCTLYWAVPDGCRPRVETIRDLVHPAASHRETCDINLRSWARLVRFKLSTKEEISGLDVFADWHCFFVTELRLQHAHARKEIENQTKDDKWTPKHRIEAIISSNQRQIESLLKTAIHGMQNAMEQAPSLDHAYRLIVKTPFDSLLGMFSTESPRVNAIVSEALKVIVAYADKDAVASLPTRNAPPAAALPVDDDSQEFDDIGDWTEIDAALGQQRLPSEAIEHVQKVLRPVVFQTVSNCFGADSCPEDGILSDVLQGWTSVARVLIRHDLQRWDNYLDPYGDESWARLRDTVQTRKFAPLFLAMCVNKDSRVISDCRVLVMGMWMSSLAERTSMLKFQNRLTEALLNGAPYDPLVQNLPFTKTKKEESYEITLTDLSQRRVSLISSILSNMRDHVQRMELNRSRELNVTKEDYSEILQQFMKAIQKNYRETGNGDPEAARGAYVQFVHQIIRFLQELTSDIRPVDAFFTDPALFPLPSSDPRYIVAKLKRYEPKLSSQKEIQTLTMFIQSISERAAMDQQQSILVEQLHKAMNNTVEDGDLGQPTLRAVLLQSVFPAYLELSFNNSASWILSRPIILTTSLALRNLLVNINAASEKCISSVMIMINAVFQASFRAFRPLSNQPLRFQDPIFISMLAAFIEMFSSALVMIDYIERFNEEGEGLISYIEWLRDFIGLVALELETPGSGTEPDAALPVRPSTRQLPPAVERLAPEYLVNARQIALEDHQSYLRNWTLHRGKYYYSRPGHDAKEVDLGSEIAMLVGNVAAAKKAFTDAAEGFTARVTKLDLLP